MVHQPAVPPMKNKDLHRAAIEMIKLHGHFADMQAAKRLDQCLNKGDIRGANVWRQLVSAIRRQRRLKNSDIEPKG